MSKGAFSISLYRGGVGSSYPTSYYTLLLTQHIIVVDKIEDQIVHILFHMDLSVYRMAMKHV